MLREAKSIPSLLREYHACIKAVYLKCKMAQSPPFRLRHVRCRAPVRVLRYTGLLYVRPSWTLARISSPFFVSLS